MDVLTMRRLKAPGRWLTLSLGVVMTSVLLSSVMAAEPPPRDTPLDLGERDSFRVVLIGDTGMDNEDMRALRRVISAERKDIIIALGDLIYPDAPACRSGLMTPRAKAMLDAGVGATLRGLGAPVLMVLGNHDVLHGSRDLPREACILHYAATEPDLVMPALNWVLDVGVVTIVGLNTNALDEGQASVARRALKRAKGWTLFAGHHVLKTYHDKEDEDVLRPWLTRHKLAPDMVANGHAHLLQAGTYGGIIALTSGSAALARSRPECPPGCQEGQRFGASSSGYALVDFSATRAEVTFYDNAGKRLHREVHMRKSTASPAAKQE